MLINFMTTNLDKDYSSFDNPIKRLVPIKEYGLPDGYYGGRVTHVAELKDSDILLLVSNKVGNKVIDTGIKLENLKNAELHLLKKMAKAKNFKFDYRKATQDELLALFGAN